MIFAAARPLRNDTRPQWPSREDDHDEDDATHALSGAAAIGGTALLPRRARAATVLRWAENQAPSHLAAQMIERAAKDVKEKTGGRVEIQGFRAARWGLPRRSRRSPRAPST